jgi:cytochrome d ubiquinol oxidase subunit I
MDAEILARIQFGFTAAFHYIFPPLSIGLGLMLVIMEGMYLKTKNKLYEQMTRFWVKVFALIFGLGVASGIVLEFGFGTNWASFSRFAGDIFGGVLAAEGIFAFFLESGFLAILVFGWDKVSPRMHFFSTIMVALGSTLSAVWIVAANSWMQTPAGHKIVDRGTYERAELVDFWAVVFNPSSMERLAHVLSGAWVAGAFFVMSVSAYYLLKNKHVDFAKASMRIALSLAIFASLLQLYTGHVSAAGVADNQPMKLAAMVGHYDSAQPADWHLFGWVNPAAGTVTGVSIPGMTSWLLHRDATEPVPGLWSVPPEDRPPVHMVFQAYHLMVPIGMALIFLSLAAGVEWARGKLWTSKLLLTALVWAVILPQLANQLGWIVAEVGRQPWIVYGYMRTSEGLSKAVSAAEVMTSLVLFGIVYAMLFVLFIFLLDRKIKAGPDAGLPEPADRRLTL